METTIIFQALAIFFSVFALSRTVLRLKGGDMTWKEFAFWAVLWIVIIIIAIIPDITFSFANILGIERGVDVLIYFSIILLFYLMFRIYVKIEKIEQDITKAVRNTAIASKANGNKQNKQKSDALK